MNDQNEKLRELEREIGALATIDDIWKKLEQALDEGTLATPDVKKMLCDGIRKYINLA